MASDIWFRPYNPPPAQQLSRAVKYALAPEYWGHSGSLSGDPIILDSEDIPFLMQCRKEADDDDEREDFTKILDAIRTVGRAEIWIDHG